MVAAYIADINAAHHDRRRRRRVTQIRRGRLVAIAIKDEIAIGTAVRLERREFIGTTCFAQALVEQAGGDRG